MLFISLCSQFFLYSSLLHLPRGVKLLSQLLCSCQGNSYCFEWPPKYRCSVMVGSGCAVESKASNDRPEGERESYDIHTHEG